MKFPEMNQNHFVLHRHPEVSLEVVEETLLILQENLFSLLLEMGDPVSKWMFSVPDLFQKDWFVHLWLENKISIFLGKYYFFCIWCVNRFQLLNVCNHYVTLPNSLRVQRVSKSKLMDSWLVFRRDRVILNQWTKWNNRSFKWLPKTSFTGRLPIRQEILNVSQIGTAFHESAHQLSFRPDCNNTADVPTFTLRTALSAIPFVSDLCGVDVQWFQERSSQALPNSKKLSVQMTLGFLFGSKNFCKLFCVSWEVFVLHGYDWIHWVAKSCTTTAYRWLFRDSHPSLRTLWSAVIKSPKISERSRASPVRLLQGALVILVLWQISQFSVFREVSFNTVPT